MNNFLLTSIVAVALFWKSVESQCIPGIAVFNKTNTLILGSNECSGKTITPKALKESPIINFLRANYSETYLLMLLESTQRSQDVFILHWLVAGVKPVGNTLMTSEASGVTDLTSGYYPTENQTMYEFRLYNMTKKQIWKTISSTERYNFYPSEWLATNGIYSGPLAKTTFMVKNFTVKPSDWVQLPNPAGSNLDSQFLKPQFPQQPPMGQQQPPLGQQRPPMGPPMGQPMGPPMGQPMGPPMGQPMGQPMGPPMGQPMGPPMGQPMGQPMGPPMGQPMQPPQYPSQPIYYQPAPHPSQYPGQYPYNPPQQNAHSIQKSYNINGTWFYVVEPGMPLSTVLNINSTLYNANSYNKRFRLTPYLIIGPKSYVWRNRTHSPGQGPFLYINHTLYVPIKYPSSEIHHYHYHKNSASSLSPKALFSILLIPFYYLLTSINN